MARISESERAGATTVLLGHEEAPDDVEGAFNDWQEKLKNAEEPGKIQAFRLPIDDRGNIGTTKAQVRLGSWAIDRYSFDELCDLLLRDYMEPLEKTMAVRLVGSKPGQAGFHFNKVVLLQRANKPVDPPASAQKESMADILRIMQEMNEKNMEMFRRMHAERPATDAMGEMQKIIAISAMLNSPMQEMMKTLLPAIAGRPQAAVPATSDAFGSLNGLLDVVAKLDELRGGGDSGGGDSDSWTNLLKAVAPMAVPALQALPAILAQRQPAAPRPALAAPGPNISQPTKPQAATAPRAPAPPAAPLKDISPTDIPSGDSQMFAQLKPQIDALVQMAAQGSDPSGAADILFDQVILELPDGLYEKLCEIVGGENFVSQCAVFNPGVKAHAEWFGTFRTQILQRIEEEDAAASSPATPSAPGVES